MRRLGVLCVAVLLLGACSSGADKPTVTNATRPPSTDVTQPFEQLQMKASELTDLLIAGKWSDATAMFSGSLKASYSPESLKLAWSQVTTKYGAYVSRGTTTRTSGSNAFDTPLNFSGARMKSRVGFNIDGQIESLYILKADAP